MNEWVLAALILIAATVPLLGVCLWAGVTSALAALEIAGTLTVSALMLLAEGFQRQPFIDLALVLAFLAVIGGLVFARMMESDL
jgi:multisubunit Na+/H+ antiporter MnhF subunit